MEEYPNIKNIYGRKEGQIMVTITIHGEQKQVQKGTTYETIVSEYQKEYEDTIAVVAVNGKIRELFKKVTKDCTVLPSEMMWGIRPMYVRPPCCS